MIRPAVAALLAGTAMAAAGCGGSSGGTHAATATVPTIPHAGVATADQRVIQGWTDAVYTGEFDRAANYFAPGAIVQQSRKFVLKTHAESVLFNSTLPCAAKLTAVRREPSGLLLASFDLFQGRLGGCPHGGHARVRFKIRNGRIELWRQLPDAPAAQGQTV